MTFSPLISRSVWTNKYSSRYGAKVQRIIPHHCASSNDGANENQLSGSGGRQVSAHYLIRNNGEIVGIVPEQFRAWTTGSRRADDTSITIEISNSQNGGNWPVSDAAFNSAARLMRDIRDRYGLGTLAQGSTVRQHREFQSTACPGPYLISNWQRLIDLANGGAPAPAPAPAPSTGGIAVDGLWGSDTNRKLQQVLGTTVDGVISSQPAAWRSRLAACTSGWEWVNNPLGSRAIAALQGRIGAEADGKFGPNSINALERHYGFGEDGRLDNPSNTVKALQRALNNGTI